MKELPGYDWSKHDGPETPIRATREYVELQEETLRDGLQGTQVGSHPEEEQKLIYIKETSKYADKIDLGFPGSSDWQKKEITRLLSQFVKQDIDMIPMVTGRGTDKSDVEAIIDVVNELDGFLVEAYIFLDGSRERAILQGWDRNEMISSLGENIRLLRSHNIPVGFVAERSTSTRPDDLRELFSVALDEGAQVLVIPDTQGRAEDEAIRNICRWLLSNFSTYDGVSFEAHFHNSRGLAVSNTLIAAKEGFDRVDVTFGAIGEGAGNADYIATIFNLNREGLRNDDLSGLGRFKEIASGLLNYEIPPNTPLYGENAWDVSSGPHQSAVLEGLRKDSSEGDIYFCVDPAELGEKVRVKIGPSSGRSGIRYILLQQKIEPTDKLVNEILSFAKKGRGYISIESILNMAANHEK